MSEPAASDNLQPLSSKGFETLYESLRRDPAAAKQAVRELDEDPRGALNRHFTLTQRQKDMLAKITDEQLQHHAKKISNELRSTNPRPVRLINEGDLHNFSHDTQLVGCGTHIVENPNN